MSTVTATPTNSQNPKVAPSNSSRYRCVIIDESGDSEPEVLHSGSQKMVRACVESFNALAPEGFHAECQAIQTAETATQKSNAATMQRMAGVTGTPAALRKIACTLDAHHMHVETDEVARMAIIHLLRMHYVAVYEKQYTTTPDIEALLQKLQQRDVISMGQWRFARKLYAEVNSLNFAKRAKATLRLADYLFEVLQRS